MSVSVGRKTMEHGLKILPEYFQAVSDGRKTFEFHRGDRGFREGDSIPLSEWDGDYTGLNPDHAVLSIHLDQN